MLAIKYRSHGIRLGHACFLTKNDIESKKYKKMKADLIWLYGLQDHPLDGKYLRTQHTVIKDIKPNEDDLFSSLGKKLRSHIRKSQREPNVRIIIYDSETIQNDASILQESKSLFEKMYASKGKHVVFNMKMAKALCQAGNLCICLAYYQDEPIGFDAILMEGNNARLWLAAFVFRDNPDEAQIYSDAHKRMDWEAIVWCKKMGIDYFDFGGINSFEEPNGIARFKMDFENNNKVDYMNYLVANSLIGKIALLFLRSK
ncbi:MAG: GNAT family N-acetyltransferase [Clostridia bacterium]|nr:GNAT family N-acetyltransferase [Clostridia bacterium]